MDELAQQQTTLRRELESLKVDTIELDPSRLKNRRLTELNKREFQEELEQIIDALKRMSKGGRLLGSPEEKEELARVERMHKESPDLLKALSGKDKLTPLENAAFNGYMQVVEFLISRNFDITNSRAIHLAAAGGRNAMVRRLIKAGAEVNRPDAVATPLAYAVAHGHPQVVQSLLTAGANANAGCWNPKRRVPMPNFGNPRLLGSDSGNLPTHWNIGAASRPLELALLLKDTHLCELLLAAGADPNAASEGSLGPLDIASKLDQLEVAVLLLKRGANVNRVFNKMTALALAGSDLMAQLLLGSKADPNLAGDPSSAPLWLASHAWDLPRVTMLIERGAIPDSNATPGTLVQSLLQLQKGPNTVNVLAVLLKAGAKFPQTGAGRLLFHAVGSKDPAFVELALQYGEKPDLVDDPEPPLKYAVEIGISRIVELLLNAGADPNKVINTDRPDGGNLSSYSLAKSQVQGGMRQRLAFAPGVKPSDVSEELQRIIALMEVKGGRDFFSQSNRLSFSANLTNDVKPIIAAGSISFAREYRLSDLLELLTTMPPANRGLQPSLLPRYPDLRRAEIYNDLDRNRPPKRHSVDMQALIDTGDFGKSIRLDWGDIVIFPNSPGSGNGEGFSMSADQIRALKTVNRRRVTVTIGEEKIPLEIDNPLAQAGRSLSRTELSTLIKGLGKPKLDLQNRFRVVRRGEPGALDEVYDCDLSEPDPSKVVRVDLQFDGTRSVFFRFQEGDEITLFPASKP